MPVIRIRTSTGWKDLQVASGVLPGASTPQFVNALPANPVDGQEIYYLADATNGVVWHLRYRAGSASAYKWEFLGGPPIFFENDTAWTGTSFGAPGGEQAADSIIPPLGGDYEVGWGGVWSGAAAVSGINNRLRSSPVAQGASTGTQATHTLQFDVGTTKSEQSREGTLLGIPANQRVYFNWYTSPTSATAVTVIGKHIRMRPIRVG